VAARGLDLPDLGLVIHADLPVNKAGLLHRSGRTGRAGKKGTSILLVPYTRRRKAEQLLGSANIEAIWQGPPSAEAIREGDQQRMLSDPVLTDPPAEEDLALARLVLESRSAEDVAAALIRLYRARLPSPEELFDDARMRDSQQTPLRERREQRHGDRAERPERAESFGRPDRLDPVAVSWFRVTVGRSKNADPKWLIPLICRLGHVTKPDIGSIKIFDKETKFEISNAVSARFAEAVKVTATDDIKIEPAGPPGVGGPAHKAGPRKGPPGKFAKGPPKGEFKSDFKGPPKGEFKPDFKGAPKGDFKGAPPKGDYKAGPKKDFKGPKKDFKGPKRKPNG